MTKEKKNNTVVIEEPKCGLCGKGGRLIKTACCDNWICDDADQYVMFSYARNSCWRNHDNYTVCAYHYHNEHQGDWLDCQECVDNFDTEDYVDMATNEYNFVKLQDPPHFEPTVCCKCGKVIKRNEEGYSRLGEDFTCDNCSDGPFLRAEGQEELTLGDEIEEYYAAKNWSEANPHLEYIQELSLELMQKVFAESPLLSKYYDRAVAAAENKNSTALSNILEEIAESYVMTLKISNPLKSVKLSSFARALQSIDNNYLLVSAKGNKYSWLLEGVAEEAAECDEEFDKIELLPVAKGFADAHRQIDEVLRTATPEYCESRKLLPTRQAAHYVADWLLQADYNLFVEDTSQRISTLCWQILLERNPALEISGMTTKFLMQNGGWEAADDFTENVDLLQDQLEDAMADPSILEVR
jgi:hypothetical protein